MMGDVFVLDKNLLPVGVIDSYKSLIWVNRYIDVGECELYMPATSDAVNLLQMGYYLSRIDDDMVCQIKKVEIDTDVDDGNYLIVTGYDVKGLLDQRIIWGTMTADGNLEDFIREMVTKTVITPSLGARAMLKANGSPLVQLGNKANFNEVITEQTSYKNVGEKIRDYCETNKWGYRFVMDNGAFWFQLYKGTDRSRSVIFSEDYENLDTTKYVEDNTNLGNVALVAGEGEGSDRSRNVSGYVEGTNRYEIYVDAKDISQTITWADLTDIYPTTDDGGQGYIASSGGGYVYKLNYLNVDIVDADQLAQLKINYPSGQVVSIDGVQYYQVYNVTIANLPSNAPQDEDNVTLWAIIYEVYLLTRGYEALAEYGSTTSFEGTVEPDITFTYKQDYFLGDIVTVENSFGISLAARIIEVVEVNDDNGYAVEPKFQYMADAQQFYLLAENGEDALLTEDGTNFITE